jgi:hypothetical protein
MNDFGPHGIWVSRRLRPAPAAEIAAAAQELEGLGFGSVWIGGSPPDDLTLPVVGIGADHVAVLPRAEWRALASVLVP